MYAIRTLLANFVYYAHMALAIYAVVGCAFPLWTLRLHVWGFPTMVAGWHLLGSCWMTNLECWIRGEPMQNRRCIGETLTRRGIVLSTKQLNIMEYTVAAIPWFITLYRLFAIHV